MLEELYDSYRSGLLRYCAAMTGEDALAEDLCQETFLRALQHLDEFGELGPGQQRSWLRKTARNCWIDSLRKDSRLSFPGEESLERGYEEDFTGGEVARLLGALPPEEGPLFRMRYFEGWNAAELGELFGLPSGTVRSRLSSARKRLQKMMKE